MPLLSPDALRAAVAPTVRRVAGPGAQQIVTLPGGASLRKYHRVTISDGEPGSIVVMELGDERKPEEATSGEPPKELPFLNVLRYLERGGIGVPHLHYYEEEAGLLYLEDLGDVTFEESLAGLTEEAKESRYRLAIDQLVAMQRYARANPSGCVAFTRGFDRTLLRWELEHFREWGLEASGLVLGAADRAELDRWFDTIAERLAAEPRLFVHRDYQSRNLMIDASDRIRLIDFQDALLGTVVYDLVALLRDSYVVLSPALVGRLVDYFVERAGLDAHETRALFDLQTVQRKLKDAGRFVFIDRVKHNPSFLQHIPSSQGYVAAALARLPELAPLRALLARHVPALGAT
jgi:aminoglycoside/choline kinase family phosphotransferase